MSDTEEKSIVLHTDDIIKLGAEIMRLETELKQAQEGERGYHHKCITIGDKLTKVETALTEARAENTTLRSELALRPAPVCLGCGKTHTECKCTDEEIEYHKRLEREQKAE